jgi:hypothetical protein
MDSVDFAFANGRRNVRRTALLAAFASVLALVAAVVASPALADPPDNDYIANSEVLGSTFDVQGTTVEATPEGGEPNHGGNSFANPSCNDTFDNSCQHSVWYVWTAPSSGPFRVATCTSDYDTTLGAYTGPDVDQLTEVASNDNGGCGINGRGSVVSFNAIAGTLYRIAVSGAQGAAGTFTLTGSPAPVIPSPGVSGSSSPVASSVAKPTKSSTPKKHHKKHHKHHKHNKHKDRG